MSGFGASLTGLKSGDSQDNTMKEFRPLSYRPESIIQLTQWLFGAQCVRSLVEPFTTISLWLSLAVVVGAMAGCNMYKKNRVLQADGVEHYESLSDQIAYTDMESDPRGRAELLERPHTGLSDYSPEYWDLSLEDAIRYALKNSTVLRDLGGTILQSPETVQTKFGSAIQRTNPRFGMEAALSAFDARFSSRALFENNDLALNNTFLGGGTRSLKQDLNDYQTEISKRAATGTEFILRNNTNYDANNAPGNRFSSAWSTNIEAEFRHPLLQGGGVEFNRIAGPLSVPGFTNGFLIARVNSDITQVDFEIGLRNFLSDVENAYWELYYAYRLLEAKTAAREVKLETWRRIKTQGEIGRRGGEADQEALAREQFFRYEADVHNALSGRPLEGTRTQSGSSGGAFRGTGGLYLTERRLRLIVGVPISEKRLIRPMDEPTVAPLSFDWAAIVNEALTRRPELKRQRLLVKRREMELTASRNFLAPRLDAIGRYRWRGFGRDLFPQGERNKFEDDGTLNANRAAVQDLFNGNFQEWQLGLELSVPIGFRRAHAAVQNAELLLAKERAILREQERQIVHDLSNAVAEMDRAYLVAQAEWNRFRAAKALLESLETTRKEGRPVDLAKQLDAQNRFDTGQIRYFLSRVEYALAIKNVNFEKASLTEYHGIVVSDDFSEVDGWNQPFKTSNQKPSALETPDLLTDWSEDEPTSPLLTTLNDVADELDPLFAGAEPENQDQPQLKTPQDDFERLPNYSSFLERAVIHLSEQQRLEEAFEIVSFMAGDTPDFDAGVFMSKLFLNAGRYDDARAWAEQAQERASESHAETIRHILADLNLRKGLENNDTQQLTKARNGYLEVLANHPDHFAVANNLIWLLDSHFGESDEAIQLVERLRQQHSIDALPIRLIDTMMTMYCKAHRFEDARQLIQEAIANKPNSAVLHFQAGLLNADIQNDIVALTEFDSAVDMGLSVQRVQHVRIVAESIERRLAETADDFETCVFMSKRAMRNGRYDAAMRWTEKLMKSAASNKRPSIQQLQAEIKLHEGMLGKNKQRIVEACDIYAEILASHSDNFVVANNLIWLSGFELDDVDRALKTAKTIRQSNGVSQLPVRLIDTILTVYCKAGLVDEASNLVETALEIKPDSALLHFQSGMIHCKVNRPEAARTELTRALESGLTGSRAKAAKRQLAELEAEPRR